MPRARAHLTWDQALDRYQLHQRARRASPRTIEGHQREVRLLQAHLDEHEIGEVTLQDLRGYQVGLLTGAASASGNPLCARTAAKVTTSLRSFFGFLNDEGLLAENPALRLERPKVGSSRPRS